MGDAMVSEFLIALFAGMVVVATFRRNTPRAVEVALWVGLVWVCILGVTNLHDPQARSMTAAAVWGASEMMGTIAAVAEQGAVQWVSDRRFLIADWVVLLCGASVLLLTFLSIRREALGWQPRVRLRDWMELPRRAPEAEPARLTLSAVDEINQRFNVWAPAATAATLTWLTLLLIWTGDVIAPTTGRKLRGAALRAEVAGRRLAAADWRRRTERVVDIEVLAMRASAMRVKAADWLTEVGTVPHARPLSGFDANPTEAHGGFELDVTRRDRRDRLAS
jgi:hypothetical protein